MWCAIAHNEDDLAGESWYTENVCLSRACAYNECACNEYLLYYLKVHGEALKKRTPKKTVD